MPDDKPRFWYGGGGALICDRSIDGLTDDLIGDNLAMEYYNGRFVIGESMKKTAAEKIAIALGGIFEVNHA